MKKHLNLLIIDDNEDDRELYTRLLGADKKAEWTIFEAETGEEAMKFRFAPVDAVLLDYSLPGHNGLKVLKDFKKEIPHLPTIMLTGQGNEVVATEAMKNGALDYLMKSHVTEENLQNALHLAIDRSLMLVKIEEQQEALHSFAQVLAHDLRSPIRSILGFSDLIMEAIAKKSTNDIVDYYDHIKRSALSILELIDTVSEFNKVEQAPHSFKVVAMQSLVDSVLHNLTQVIKESNARVTFDMELPEIVCNEPLIMQLLQNLIANGIKYCRQPVPKVHIGFQTQKGYRLFSVKDNGIGIAEEYYKTIFDMFKRLHGKGGEFDGNGIGLAICKKVVDRHHGRIWCESEIGKGTTFFFTIPQQIPVELVKHNGKNGFI